MPQHSASAVVWQRSVGQVIHIDTAHLFMHLWLLPATPPKVALTRG